MGYNMRQLADAEKEAFIKDNFWGVLSFAGGEPYAIPVGYQYIKGDVLQLITNQINILIISNEYEQYFRK